MNEPASFCNYPCTDPFAQAKQQTLPPPRTSPPPDPNVPMRSLVEAVSAARRAPGGEPSSD